MFNVGTVCVKIAGRDAGSRCVVVEEASNGFVLIEGESRRRKCNVCHLEPTGEKVKVAKGADHATVMKALGLSEKPSKTREKKQKPSANRKSKPKTDAPASKKKSSAKKAKKEE